LNMRKTKKIVKEVEEEVYFCDVCGNECSYFERFVEFKTWGSTLSNILDISKLEICPQCVSESLTGKKKFKISITLENESKNKKN